jgi:hypothetical protein
MEIWTDFIFFRMGFIYGLYGTQKCAFRFHETGIYLLAELLVNYFSKYFILEPEGFDSSW